MTPFADILRTASRQLNSINRKLAQLKQGYDTKVAALSAEAGQIRSAVQSLQTPTASRGASRRSVVVGTRRAMTAAQKKAVSVRMKAYWAKRRASRKS